MLNKEEAFQVRKALDEHMIECTYMIIHDYLCEKRSGKTNLHVLIICGVYSLYKQIAIILSVCMS